ncbi:MAG: hypothetical protein DMD66_02065 [Gemmatimonadetes bacterium]|nr:MAG: hypothetical protein DMD66_02065 [Gemmatimonadota bacterium]
MTVRRARARKTVQEVRADSRMWPLLERYCKLAKVKLLPRGADLYELKLPLSERAHFGDRATVRVALSLEALERDPDAEMAVLGSPFLGALLEAIRTRAGQLSLGIMPPKDAEGRRRTPNTQLTVPVRDGTARRRKSALATHTVGRLLARIVLRAGAVVEETVIESAVIDLATGARADDQVTALFADLEARRIAPADPGDVPDATAVPARAPAEILQLLLGDLRERSAERVAARQAGAEQGVAAELERLDRYRRRAHHHRVAQAAARRGGAPPSGDGDRASAPARPRAGSDAARRVGNPGRARRARPVRGTAADRRIGGVDSRLPEVRPSAGGAGGLRARGG